MSVLICILVLDLLLSLVAYQLETWAVEDLL